VILASLMGRQCSTVMTVSRRVSWLRGVGCIVMLCVATGCIGGRSADRGMGRAGTLFMALDGDDANDGRALDRPVRTFARASALAIPGDVVQVRGGVYAEFVSITSSGTEQAPIVFEPYRGEKVTIDGSAIKPDPEHPDTWNWTPKLFSIRASHVVVRGFEGRNSPNDIFFLAGHHITLDGVWAHDGYLGGIRLSDTYSSQVLNSTVHDIFDTYQDGENSDCIASAGGERGHDNVIRGNLVYNCGDDGIDTWDTRRNVVEGNIAHHCGRGSEGDGNGFKMGGPGGGDNVVRFNAAYMNRAIGFTTNSGDGNQVYNNTAWRNGGVGFQSHTYVNTLQNNIAVPAELDLRGPVVSRNNSWDLDMPDPVFRSVDPRSGMFLHLSRSSPAIDRGVVLAGATYRGAAPDLGAYEYTPECRGLIACASRR
jgi:parallel beta-helix repeat protein